MHPLHPVMIQYCNLFFFYEVIFSNVELITLSACPPCSPNLLSPNVVSPKKPWENKFGETVSFLSPTTVLPNAVLPNADSPNFPRLGKCIKQSIASW